MFLFIVDLLCRIDTWIDTVFQYNQSMRCLPLLYHVSLSLWSLQSFTVLVMHETEAITFNLFISYSHSQMPFADCVFALTKAVQSDKQPPISPLFLTVLCVCFALLSQRMKSTHRKPRKQIQMIDFAVWLPEQNSWDHYWHLCPLFQKYTWAKTYTLLIFLQFQ